MSVFLPLSFLTRADSVIDAARVEVIANLDDMCLGLLNQFVAKNKKRPASVSPSSLPLPPLLDIVRCALRERKLTRSLLQLIFFRDGVSEGQFSQVLSIEVNAIRLACQRISPDYKPALTYIVCGKRHHMSFFPKNEADGDRKNFNVKAGVGSLPSRVNLTMLMERWRR